MQAMKSGGACNLELEGMQTLLTSLFVSSESAGISEDLGKERLAIVPDTLCRILCSHVLRKRKRQILFKIPFQVRLLFWVAGKRIVDLNRVLNPVIKTRS